MVEERKDDLIYGVFDIHGVTLIPILPWTPIQNIPRQIKESEIERLLDQSKTPGKLLELTQPLAYQGEVISQVRHPVLDRSCTQKLDYGKHLNSYTAIQHKHDFFETYKVVAGIQKVFEQLYKEGMKLQFASGIPDCCADYFRDLMVENNLWQYLDPENPAFLTSTREFSPGEWVEKSIHPMIAKIALVYDHQIKGEEVILIEDSPRIAETAAALGINVLLLRSRPVDSIISWVKQYILQKNQSKQGFLDRCSRIGVIIPVKNVLEIPNILRYRSYFNHG